MKCKNCGGELIYRDGMYVCENCGSRASVADYYDATEAFICCVENDAAGRRTKDSIIAQDLYNALSSNKVNTFYGRISAGDLAGEEYEKVSNAALHSAKTVIVLGTNKQNFETLNEKYADFYAGRTVIPVFSDMDAYDIPKGMSAVQALDYGRVGAVTDLVKGVLNTLGRSGEVDVVKVANKAMDKRRKRTILAVVLGVTALIAAVAVALVLILRPKQAIEETNGRAQQEEANSQKYSEAVKLTEEGEYKEALAKFAEITGYKDSDKLRTNIYNKYAGYYKNDATNITLHFQVWDGNTGNIDFAKIDENGEQCRIVNSSAIVGNTLSVDFTDSANNRGEMTVVFENDRLKLDVKTTEIIDENVNFGDCSVEFLTADRSDKPLKEEVTLEKLIGFVTEHTTLSDVNKTGVELEYVDAVYIESATDYAIYNVKNTNYYLIISPSQMVEEYEKALAFDYNMYTSEKLDDPVVYFVVVPQSTLGAVGETVTLPAGEDAYYLMGNDYSVVFEMSAGRIMYGGSEYTVTDQTDKFPADYEDYYYDYDTNTSGVLFVTGKGALGENGLDYYKQNLNGSFLENIPSTDSTYYTPYEYILFNSSTEPVYSEQLLQLSAWELKLARNEIYARHGRMFKDQDIQNYFNSKSWYFGIIPPDQFDESVLSDVERNNIKLIKTFEEVYFD